ncbi:MAG: alpha/beta-type small acid-soluble spore protein [Firmicutes bacterium]|nr:alpha/beta-type small acid-soluble spore protein [Bacillota bacterium]
MGAGQKRNTPLIQEAYQALQQFKYETANELGIQVPEGDYWGYVSSRDCGAVGGNMVRKMIAAAEQSLIAQAGGNTQQNY